ncbi:MAG: hypothetical protein Q8Q96_00620 [bacterium]|nr:hypothetical protein [bacterium]
MEEQNQQQTLPPQQPPILPQNVNPIPPPQQYSYGKRSWLKWGLIIVFVVIISSGATYLILNSQPPKRPPPQIVQPTPTPTISQPSPTPDLYTEGTRSTTANWKIYTNKQYSFQFKYPPDYRIEREDSDKVIFSSLFQPGDQIIPASLTVSWGATTDVNSLKKCEGFDRGNNLPYSCKESLEVKAITVNSIRIIRFDIYSGVGDNQAKYEYIAQTQSSPKIEFRQYVYGGGILKNFNQILSTFRFINP